MQGDENSSLILHPGSGLALVGPQGGRIVAEMVGGALALTRTVETSSALATAKTTALIARFSIGEHEFCEPDYQQILLWAEETGKSPHAVVLRLEQMKSFYSRGEPFPDGRLIEVYWDYHSMLIRKMDFVEGLKTRVFCLRFGDKSEDFYRKFGHRGSNKYRTRNQPIGNTLFSLNGLTELEVFDVSSHGSLTALDFSAVPRLMVLRCDGNQLAKLDLSTVPQLAELSCGGNQLTHLDLSAVPRLTALGCSSNQLSKLDISAVRQLTELHCDENQLTELDLSAVPRLTSLDCEGNNLTDLDLSMVPQLTELSCHDNQLSELDIRPLKNLVQLTYDEEETRLIKRPDQKF